MLPLERDDSKKKNNEQIRKNKQNFSLLSRRLYLKEEERNRQGFSEGLKSNKVCK